MLHTHYTQRHLPTSRHFTLAKRGFTLIEIMVALMIFSIVVVVALAALVKIIDANKKSQTIQNAVVNMSFTMESMTRELRTGSTYLCKPLTPGNDLGLPGGNSLTSQDVSLCNGVTGASGNGVGFAFLSNTTASNGAGGTCRLIKAYELVPDPSVSGTFIFKKGTQAACSAALVFAPVIDTGAMSITSYYVAVSNVQYPLLFIKMDGSSGAKESIKTTFTIQTAASPRLP
jgi:prepilin-type N-terminal cleavage/methylation domain-containing protein